MGGMQEKFNDMSISVVVPAYNEEQSLPELILRLNKTIQDGFLKNEIIIVDDGSTDRTGQVADRFSEEYSNVKVVHHRRNLGKAEVLKTALKLAKGDLMVIIDADLQYYPEDIPKLLELSPQRYDVISGWRKVKNDPLGKRFSSYLYNLVTRKVFGLSIHDCNSGLKLFKRSVLRSIITSDFRVEQSYLLALAHHLGYRIGKVEVRHAPRKYGKSKYNVLRAFDIITRMTALKLQFWFYEKPMLLFGMTGFILSFIGLMISLRIVIEKYVFNLDVNMPILLLAVLFITTGLQSFFFGFLAESQAVLRREIRRLRN